MIGTGIKDPRWRPYLEPYGGLDQLHQQLSGFEHHDHTDGGGVLPAPHGRSRPIRRGEQPEPLSA